MGLGPRGVRSARRRASARSLGRKLSPLALVAPSAGFGIGLIVIGVNVVSSVMSDAEPNAAPPVSASVEPTATTAASSPVASAEAERLQRAFEDQRRALREEQARASGGGGGGGGGCEFCIE